MSAFSGDRATATVRSFVGQVQGSAISNDRATAFVRSTSPRSIGIFATIADLPTTGLVVGDWAKIVITEDPTSGLIFHNVQGDGSAWSVEGKTEQRGVIALPSSTAAPRIMMGLSDPAARQLQGFNGFGIAVFWLDSQGSPGVLGSLACWKNVGDQEAGLQPSMLLTPGSTSFQLGPGGAGALDWTIARTGTATATLTGTIAGGTLSPDVMRLPNDISPAQIVANTDEDNPAGLSTATVLRLSTDASRNLTGIVGGTDGRLLNICNIGAFNLVLKHDVTSTAANRFYCPGSADFTLTPNSTATLLYDSTSSRWRVK